MRLHAPVLAGGLAVLVLGFAILSAHADEKADILKLAAMLEKGEDVTSAAASARKLDLDAVMVLLKLRSKEGLGVGPKAGEYPANQDGIEAKIIGLAKKALTDAEVKKQAADIAQAAYITAAIGYATDGHKPAKKIGDKDPKEWEEFTQAMKKEAMNLAAAAKKGDPMAIKNAAAKLNSSCNNCHGIFRD